MNARTSFCYSALLSALTLAVPAAAVDLDAYAGVDFGYLAIPVASADFGSVAWKLRAGATLSSGWGLEVQTLAGFSDDSVGDLTLQADNITALLLRYETNPAGSYRFFVSAGYATSSLSFDGPDTAGLDDRYDGFAFGFGAMERIEWLPNTMAVLEGNSYFNDSNVDIWSVSFGLRYEF